MRVATEDKPYFYSSLTNIVMSTISDKTLVNLAQNKDPSTRLEKNIVLALRVDDCKTGVAQLVVKDKSAKFEKKAVSKSFTLFDKKVQKTPKAGVLHEVRFSTTVEFLASGTNDYGVLSGNITIVGSTKIVINPDPAVPYQCPSSLSGFLLGDINILLQDSIGGGPFPVTKDAIIMNGSKLSAKLLKQ